MVVGHFLRRRSAVTGVFIFSRDRALQLDACLRSLAENAPQLGYPTVLARWSAPEFEQGYEILRDEHPAVDVVEESDFETDVRRLLPALEEHVLFLCDDSITFRPLPADPAEALTDDVISVSLRLGRNSQYCHPRDLWHEQPASIEERGPFLAWDWAESPEGDLMMYHGREGDFGYPYSLDGIVHRRDSIIEWTQAEGFTNPNRMEGCVIHKTHTRGTLPPKLASFHHSVQVGLPINQVNVTTPNRHGLDFPRTIEELNDRYLRGGRIDYHAMDFSSIVGPFQELDLAFA